MQTVYLNGGLSQFGEKWTTECKDIASIFKLIECQTPGFRKYLSEAVEADVGFEIQRGSEFLENPEELLLSLNDEDIIITEVPSGSKSAGGKILAAIAIAVLTFYTAGALTSSAALASTFGGNAAAYVTAAKVVASIGYSTAINLAITGITQLLAPGPETEPDKKDSYLFSGPSNNGRQGLPVPILYGELIVGGMPISAYYSNSRFIASSGVTDLGMGVYTKTGQNGDLLLYNESLNEFINLSDIDEILAAAS